MLISEIFYSVQGEGQLNGVPSVFVRTSGCNLRCSWCDTPYASWQPEGTEMELADIVAAVQQHRSARHVVLTGGEPMIARDIHALATQLKALDYHLTIETAATVSPRGIPCDLASLSPKLRHSTPSHSLAGAWAERHERTRLQPDVIREWLVHSAYQLKFVVSSDEDLAEIHQLLRDIDMPIPPSQVLLMPEGIDAAHLHAQALRTVEWCKQTGYRYCPRLHIDLFGHTRGT